MNRYRPHLLVICVLAVVVLLGLEQALQLSLSDLRFRWFSREATGSVVVVAIDSPSIERVGVWPWPRRLHAELLDKLGQAGVTDVVFDVDFSSPSTEESDAAFEAALKRAGGLVVLPFFKQQTEKSSEGVSLHVSRPLKRFAEFTWPAAVNVQADSDGVLRRYPLGQTLDGIFIPSAAALLAGAQSTEHESLLVDFGIRASSIPVVSFADVLSGDPSVARSLEGKKILIGATALELGDRFNVPGGQIIPGVVLQALATETLLQGRALHVTSKMFGLFGSGLIILVLWGTWRRISGYARVCFLLILAASIEIGAALLQASTPVSVDTSLFHVVIAAYLVATALDEIDLRDWLGMIAERRFQRIAMSLGDGLVCVDQNGRITFWNPGAQVIFGYSSEEMLGEPSGKILDSASRAEGASWPIWEVPADALHAAGGHVTELRARRKNGQTFPVELSLSEWRGAEGPQFGLLLRDITVRKREMERIQYLAEYDTLTDLPNRTLLQDSLNRELEAAKANGGEVALLLLDLDKFKEVNDTLGHACGDALLRQVAATLKESCDGASLVARISGDEFAIIITGFDAAVRAAALSARIIETFGARHFLIARRKLTISFSIGAAVYPQHGENITELLANADVAMYRAKACGRDQYVLFDQDMRLAIEARLQIERALDHALAHGEFELFYQPQVNLISGAVVGAEALVRWRRPGHGLVSPAQFLPVLHESPNANVFATWVLRSACEQARRWQVAGHGVRVGINLSPCQFQSDDIVDLVSSILNEISLSPELVELEVTENILLDDDEKARATFQRFQELKVHLALDDFGTGFASLNYLKKFPLNRLKIDQYFIRELKPGSSDAAIVEYTIGLSKLLGLSVIAEGIEHKATADLLKTMGCEEGQGYYFGRPAPASEFEANFLLRNPDIKPEEPIADRQASAA